MIVTGFVWLRSALVAGYAARSSRSATSGVTGAFGDRVGSIVADD
jgi:hypothetical protein